VGRIPLCEKMRTRNYTPGAFLVEASRLSVLGWLAFAFLWILVFTIPWETAFIIPNFGTFTRLIGMLAGGLGVLAIIEKPRFKVPGPGHVLIALFMVWAAATYWWSTDPKGTVVAASSYFQLLVMVWLIWELAPTEREQRRLMQAYVLGTCVSATDTVYQYISHEEIAERYASTGFNPNDLALALALAIPLSYYLSIQSAGWKVWVYRLQLVLTGTAILLTASRGGFLASLVALTIVPLTYTRLTWLQRVASALTLGILVCSALFYIPSTSWGALRHDFQGSDTGYARLPDGGVGSGLGVIPLAPLRRRRSRGVRRKRPAYFECTVCCA
jgi:hypothetical protein